MKGFVSAAWMALLGFTLYSNAALAQIGETNAHGLALGTKPIYGPDLKFKWVNEAAPKGGRVVLGTIGTFDSLNPFAIKSSADGLLYGIDGSGAVFENLHMRSLGEAFTTYSMLAKGVDVAKDGMSVTYYLHSEAKWSDGKPLTADDVLFSYKILTTDKAPPLFRLYYGDVKGGQVIDKTTIKFTFKTFNRELPLIMGELPILPKHIYGAPGKDFIKAYVKQMPVGSGPYIVKSYEFGKYIEYARNPNYWGKDKAFSKGAWNFDTIYVKYYKDQNAMMEGFKAGDFDIRPENSSKAWAVDHAGPKWDKKWIMKELWPHNQNQGGQGFVFNLRKPIFQDRLTRKALSVAFDFDWANETLFYKQYTVSTSFFNNSEFNAKGLPDAKELALLNPLKDKLPAEVFTEAKDALGKGLTGKRRLAEALNLLKQAGWELKDGVQTNKKGEKLTFTFLLDSPVMGRVVEPYIAQLEKIGIKVNLKTEDPANYVKRVEKWDFDVISMAFGQSESPGNEQRDYWHSKAASQSESRNFMGLKDPAVDALVEKVIAAKNREELVITTRALDRVLWNLHIMVPNWYMAAHRVSWWNKFGQTGEKPLQYSPTEFIVRYGWSDQNKETALQSAVKNNKSL
jgi:microcin C transport system substrate-binding protein